MSFYEAMLSKVVEQEVGRRALYAEDGLRVALLGAFASDDVDRARLEAALPEGSEPLCVVCLEPVPRDGSVVRFEDAEDGPYCGEGCWRRSCDFADADTAVDTGRAPEPRREPEWSEEFSEATTVTRQSFAGR